MRYLLICCLFLSSLTHALSLKPDAPKRYVVKSGDSLWSIANKYLERPWEWKQLLHANPNIKNPNHLYVGSTLILDSNAAAPSMRVLPGGTIKLSPFTRKKNIKIKVPPIHLGTIKPFLNESLILDQDILPQAPYIVGLLGERMLGGQGDEAYVRKLHPSTELPSGGTIAYSVFRTGSNYVDPITKRILGFRARLVGYAELVKGGEPATVILTSIVEGVQKDDKVLINNAPEFELDFEPQAPENPIHGYIIDMPIGMPNGNSQAAAGDVVVINHGETSGLRAGDILAVYSKSRMTKDPQHDFVPIRLPPERIGEVMIFRAFTKTSFGLIVRSTNAIYLGDSVANP